MEYSIELKELLLSNNNIKAIWFKNDNSEVWYTAPTKDCKEISRDEILGTKKVKKANGIK
jgi:hypothetical protein